MFNPFNAFFPKKMVGIDIGASSVKIVEISRMGQGKTLENYGEIKSASLYPEASLQNEGKKDNYVLSNEFAARVIRGILDEAGIRTKSAIFSISDFSSFCTSFDMPPMDPKEIPDAIHYNASQYITLPISEVTLDWQVIPQSPGDKNSSMKVFLVAVPNQVVMQYQTIARLAGLNLYAIEPEVLGVTRALIKNNKKIICLIDIGIQSSTINIIDKGFLKKSYSFSFNSAQLSHVISSTLGISLDLAEEVKSKEGLMHSRQEVVKALYHLIDPLLIEVKSISSEFYQLEQKQIDQVYLTGGTANLPGLKEYFAEVLKKEVIVPSCFSEFLYPPILEETLRKMSPGFSVAVGVALGGFNNRRV